MNNALSKLEELLKSTDFTYSFGSETAGKICKTLIQIMMEKGLDPRTFDGFGRGILEIFNVEVVNMPDLDKGRYIFVPNHVSDFDALILAVLHPRIRVVSKNDWAKDDGIKDFWSTHFDLYGIDRTSMLSLRNLLRDSFEYFSEQDKSKHLLIFSQGTISDFNKNSPERVSSLAKKISDRANVPMLPIFVEQASLHHPTRIVFGEPIKLSDTDDFRMVWLDSMRGLQESLKNPPARVAKLSHKHSNNNKPGDEFFISLFGN